MNKKFNLFSILSLGLIFILTVFLVNDQVLAQKKKKKKKKGKNHEQHDQAYLDSLRKAYELELAKFWSFGYENYKNKQYADATKHFWKVVQLDTINKFPRVYRYLAQCYFQLQKPDSAEYVLKQGVEQHPEDDHLHRMLGYIYAQKEQTDLAITEYEKVVQLEPESIDDWKQLAVLYVKADRLEDAIKAYNTILQKNPDDEEVRKTLSALYEATGSSEEAIAMKEQVREQEPENAQVRFELGKIYFDRGDYEKAIERFQELLKLTPDDLKAMEYLGNSYQKLEQYTKAIQIYKQILQKQPDNKKIMADISRAYKDLGNFTQARSYAYESLAIDRQYGLGWIALGESFEASAEKCVGKKQGKIDFDDKMVYELAYQKYRMALSDLEFKSEAERKISYLKPVLPTTEDVFMHRRQKRPKAECYKWIPDSEFGKNYWDKLNQRTKR